MPLLRFAPLSVVACVSLVACSALVLKPDDTGTEVGAKVVSRILIGLPTLGISEFFIANERDRVEAQYALQEYRSSLTSMVNNGQITAIEAENLYLRRLQLLNDQVASQIQQRAQRLQAVGAAMQGVGAGMQSTGQSYNKTPASRDIDCTTTQFGSISRTRCW